MSYQKHVWVTNEIIRGKNLNHIEDGIYQEQERAMAAEDEIESSVTAEQLRAQTAEISLGSRITQNTNAISVLNGDASVPGSVDNKIANAPLAHEIADGEGNTYPQRSKLVIENATITDDADYDQTIVTPEGGGSALDNFVGTTIEWEALTTEEKATYHTLDIINDYNGYTLDNIPTQNSPNAVSSGGVYTALQSKAAMSDVYTLISGVESTSTASQAYLVGQYLIYNQVLYRVSALISSGDTLVSGTNIVPTKVADEISNHLSVAGTEFYFDTHDGVYGYNTSANRGADTFVPFKRSEMGLSDNVKALYTTYFTNYTTYHGASGWTYNKSLSDEIIETYGLELLIYIPNVAALAQNTISDLLGDISQYNGIILENWWGNNRSSGYNASRLYTVQQCMVVGLKDVTKEVCSECNDYDTEATIYCRFIDNTHVKTSIADRDRAVAIHIWGVP